MFQSTVELLPSNFAYADYNAAPVTKVTWVILGQVSAGKTLLSVAITWATAARLDRLDSLGLVPQG